MEIKSQSLLVSKKEVEMFLLGGPIFFEADDLNIKDAIERLNVLGVSILKQGRKA
jgi:hypothetical protein